MHLMARNAFRLANSACAAVGFTVLMHLMARNAFRRLQPAGGRARDPRVLMHLMRVMPSGGEMLGGGAARPEVLMHLMARNAFRRQRVPQRL